jgi:hypothetical protein
VRISYILTFLILWFFSAWFLHAHHAPLKLLIFLPVLPLASVIGLILWAVRSNSAFYFSVFVGLGVLLLLFLIRFFKRRNLLAVRDRSTGVVIDTYVGIVIYWLIIFAFSLLIVIV